MDNLEASAVFRGHLDGYRRRTYSELVGLRGRPQTAELQGASGSRYQIEVEVHWDAGRPPDRVRRRGPAGRRRSSSWFDRRRWIAVVLADLAGLHPRTRR